ncbi:hemolysin family protein [Elioraea rosea]|uniref:hemolysin family protein n=1 Tax=Elioraea rosea TaxID=2492390 RepID=UPI0011835C54|nr:hemolysin family protein [Elioraea rosea]
MDIALEILVILLLIGLNGVLALSELAVVSSRKPRLKAMARKGVRGAAAALALAEDPQRFLPTVQVGITLVGVLAGAFGGATLAFRLGAVLDRFAFISPNGEAVAFAIVVAVITLASIVLGEIVPKTLALRRPETLAVALAPFLTAVSRAASPAVWLLRVLSGAVLALFGAAKPEQSQITEEEVKALVQESAAAGVIEHEEQRMIERVLRLPDRSVRAVMTPRTEVAWLDRADPPHEIVEQIRESPHARFVVCDGSLDNVVGVVRAKDLLDQVLGGETLRLAAALVRPTALPDSMSVLQALEILRRERLGIAFVVDEYGSFEGVVTAYDMLEAIVGEVAGGTVADTPTCARRADGSWLMDGLLPADEVRARLGLPELPSEGDYNTLAGLILTIAGRIPSEGDQIAWENHVFEVVDMDGRRIDKVIVRPTAGVVPDV